MDIGERLLKLRKGVGLSQEEVANKLGVSRQTISKWETGESNPDFDKIIPICELYNITTDELIKGTPKEVEDNRDSNSIKVNNREARKKTAKVLAISIFLYFVSIIWVVIVSSYNFINEETMIGIFLFIVAIATCIIIYHFVANGKGKNELYIERRKKYGVVDNILALLFTILYFVVSFTTWRFDISWIIWIVYALVIEIAHLIIDSKEKNKNE